MTRHRESPSQTAGPYVHIGCTPSVAGLQGAFRGVDHGSSMAGPEVAGERIVLSGRVLDGAGAPVTDALLEAWQADAAGGLSPGLWGRQATDGEGQFRFNTVKPGAAIGAPHVALWIVARGINLGLHTRAYFPDALEANAADPVLRLAGARAGTMVAAAVEGGYALDIRLQGERETVFLDV